MPITKDQFTRIFPNAGKQAGVFVPVLNAAMGKFDIVTPTRTTMFLAQVGHETGEFRWLREFGNDAYLARYDTGALAARLGNTPEADGDGQKYRGRGLIQITGRNNYKLCGEALGLDLLRYPELLEKPEHAAMSAAWFWKWRGINSAADAGDLEKVTRFINGGLNGLEDRLRLWKRAREVLCP